MISKQTAMDIALAYREVETARRRGTHRGVAVSDMDPAAMPKMSVQIFGDVSVSPEADRRKADSTLEFLVSRGKRVLARSEVVRVGPYWIVAADVDDDP